ncbi:transcriptional regulator [Sporomusaceae bacterium FL31]|nr:transcriptional regulator [Sporomusaceae bacterium FL31]GCE32995.1 transcriptional regulator [Sporomusaceae bacterium]
MDELNNGHEPQLSRPGKQGIMYDSGTIKVIVFACIVIILAVALTGSVSYFITRNAVVDKLKSRDLVYITESIVAKIDGRIERAKETAVILAKDPTLVQWVSNGEQDELLGKYSQAKINDIAQNHDYANSFIVSAVTNNYWAEGFSRIQTMSKANPSDNWFFDTLQSGKAVELNIDYNSKRQDTFVFINALVGDVQQPIAVTGVGLSLQSIATEFQKYKFGERSNLWLVDSKGKIHLSDNIHDNGKYLNDFVPVEVFTQVIHESETTSTQPNVIEYTNANGETIDLAYQLTKSTDWKVVFQIPRSESIALLGNIKLNTAIASLVALFLMIFVFYVISQRMANPLKRALLLTEEMEKQVGERTRELVDKNQKIMDSIDYAKRLQESILPTKEELSAVFDDYFILWAPRDVVGGDFFWVRQIDAERSLIAVGDCTGHGVPGAFMTMAVNSVLKHIVDQNVTDPALILSELNCRMKEILHRNNQNRITDDGLDIGICYIEKSKKLVFAGAKVPLFIRQGSQVHVLKGGTRSIGYQRSSNTLTFNNHIWEIQANDQFYLTTDGYIDQNGGIKDLPFSRKRFISAIIDQSDSELSKQKDTFESILNQYRANEPQRDDITLLGFCFK